MLNKQQRRTTIKNSTDTQPPLEMCPLIFVSRYSRMDQIRFADYSL